MHLGLVCDEYPPSRHGGIGSYSRDLAESLVKAGHQVTVIGIYNPKVLVVKRQIDEVIQGVRVLRLPPLPPRVFRTRPRLIAERLWLSQRLRQLHRQQPFDLIECPDSLGWLAFGAPRGVPLVVRLHGSRMYFAREMGYRTSRWMDWAERRCTARADFLVSVSAYTARLTLELCGLPDREFTVIYNAVDTETFSPSESVPTENGLITFVNSLSPKKGVEELIQAMNIVGRSHPEAHLVLIGKDVPGQGRLYSATLLDQVDPDLRDRVTFTGPLDRYEGVLPYLRKAQVCVYPSHSEAFAISPLEAMAVGKPTIFTRRASGPEAVEDGVSGLLCDPHSPEDIAQKIQRVLDDPDLAARLGQGARQRVLQRFDRRAWAQTNLDFFEACLAPAAKKNGTNDAPR